MKKNYFKRTPTTTTTTNPYLVVHSGSGITQDYPHPLSLYPVSLDSCRVSANINALL